jgi:hypothetical protein
MNLPGSLAGVPAASVKDTVTGVNVKTREFLVLVPFHIHRHSALDRSHAEVQTENRETQSHSCRLRTL